MNKIRKTGKIKWIPIIDEIYKKNFHLCYGGKSADFVGFLVRYHREDILSDLKLLENSKGAKISIDGYNYIWVSNCHNAEAVMVHELLHFVISSLKDCQIPLTNRTEDTHCYYIEYLYEKIMKVFNKLKK